MAIISRRATNVPCPKCENGHLTAISVSLMKGHISHSECDKCPAYYDAEIYHTVPQNEHWWIGKLRNPDFWNYPNRTVADGLAEMARKAREGIPDYIGTYPIEKIA